jgi:acetylornithine deacetylase/succinyl-diaminopimelate desuccinylase-like protein
MSLRRDSLAAAAEDMGLIEAAAAGTGATVGTVGQLDIEPGGINIIPGRVEFSLDLRDLDEGVRDRVEGRTLEGADEVCRRRSIGLEVETLQWLPPPARSWSGAPHREPARGRACVFVLSRAALGTTGCSSRVSARWA